jgi:hypothetical protein
LNVIYHLINLTHCLFNLPFFDLAKLNAIYALLLNVLQMHFPHILNVANEFRIIFVYIFLLCFVTLTNV